MLDFIHNPSGLVNSFTWSKLVSTRRVTLSRKEDDPTTRVTLLTVASQDLRILTLTEEFK